jgi:hypothetical protein
MCVRLIDDGMVCNYDSSRPLEEQIGNDTQVVINYEPKDPDINTFLVEMERLCKSGISANVKVEIQHNNAIKGIKAKKQLKRLKKDLDLNQAIKLLVNLQRKTDITLEELSNFCRER